MRSPFPTLLIYAHFVLFLANYCRCDLKQYAGPYILRVDSVIRCKTKPNPDHIPANFTIAKSSDGEEQFIGYFNIASNIKFTKGVIKTYTDVKVANFVQDINRPCKGIIFSLILNQHLNADKDCVVKKGIYKVDVKPNKLIHTFFSNVPHGNYRFSLLFYAKKTELMCIDFNASIVPMSKPK